MTATITRPPDPPSTPATSAPAGTTPRPSRRTPTPSAELWAELALAAVTIATAVSFCRLFLGWDFLWPLLLAGITSHLLAVACRRGGWGGVVSFVASLAVAGVVVTVTQYRDTSAYGFPTFDSWDSATADLAEAWDRFAVVVAPVPNRAGYLVASMLAIWLAAFLADSFAFRGWATFESLLPSGVVFVFVSALASPRNRISSTALYLAAALAFALLHRQALQQRQGTWLASQRDGATRATLRVGALVGGAALVAGAVLGPSLPGAGEAPLLSTKGGSGDGTRVTLSPLVDIRGRLANSSATLAFTVRASEATYWRLTALDRFDGKIWSSSRSYRDVSGPFTTQARSTVLRQDFTIAGLDSIWLPAAFSPINVTGGSDLAFDPETSSIVTGADSSNGQTYSVVSALSRPTKAQLEGASGPLPASIASTYLPLPADFPTVVTQQAAKVTAGATTPYEKARRLQDWFRVNFTYDLSVRAGHDENAIVSFLRQGRGYCEQFAGTFAAMARSLGVPARVAVGFTPGMAKGDGTFQVLGKYAHAWPEVWFNGIGWVAFEPTPGRGAPGLEDATGVAAQQADQPATSSTATTTPGSTTSRTTVPGEPVEPETGLLPFNAGGQGSTTDHHQRPLGLTVALWLLGLAVLAGGWLLVVPALRKARWRRRRDRASSPADRALVSWAELGELLDRLGMAPIASQTPHEVAERAAVTTTADPRLVQRIADRTSLAAYAPQGVSADEADCSQRDVSALEHEAWDRASWLTRLGWLADPRPLWRRDDSERSSFEPA